MVLRLYNGRNEIGQAVSPQETISHVGMIEAIQCWVTEKVAYMKEEMEKAKAQASSPAKAPIDPGVEIAIVDQPSD